MTELFPLREPSHSSEKVNFQELILLVISKTLMSISEDRMSEL